MGGTLSKPDPARAKKVQVIGVGYSKTGTSSMQLALERLLHAPVYHGGTHHLLGFNDAHNKMWTEASVAKFIDNDRQRAMKLIPQLLEGYAGAIDMPIHMFVPELVTLYPEAKFILCTRDSEKWWKSMQATMAPFPEYSFRLLTFPTPGMRWLPKEDTGFRVNVEQIMKKTKVTQGDLARGHGPGFLEAYNAEVIKIVPKERLLIMEVKDGWAPLCKFLGKPIPDEPFPHVNEAAAYDYQAKVVLAKLMLVWMGWLSAVGGVAYLGLKFWRR